MYCKNCGKQISDDSKFCQYCGEKQNTNEKLIIEKKSENQPRERTKNVKNLSYTTNKLSNVTKYLLCGYGLWFVMHLYFLFAGDKSYSSAEYFQPFSEKLDSKMSYYDISEFIVYTIGAPLLLWGYYMYITHDSSK